MSLKSIISTTCAPHTRHFFLNLLNKSTTLSHLTQLHAHLLLHGLQNDIAVATKLTHKLFNFNATSHASALFFTIPKPDLFLFNVLIKGFSNNNSPLSAISLFTHLRKSTDLYPDNFTYAFVVSAARNFGDAKIGFSLHGRVIVDGLSSDLFVGSALVDMYFKLSREDIALKVFDKLPERDTILYNTMISGLVRVCCYEDSIRLFKYMISGNGPQFDSTTVIAVLPALAELQELRLGTEIQCLAIKLGFLSHISVVTGLISLYSKCGDVDTASILFTDIGRKDLISYNAMISGLTFNGETESSVRLFEEWLDSGEKVNSSSIVGLIPVYCPFGYLPLTNCIHGFGVKSGIVSHSSVATALTTVYSRLNEMEAARQLFDESSEKTLASWNAMIAGYTQNGATEKAISLFQEMQMYNISPNPVTVTSILSACAQLGALTLGKWIHGLVKFKSFEYNVYVSTALIDMYAKCGSILEARRLFDSMPEKNEVTWNAIISGYGLHGLGQEALKLFYEMLNCGIQPTRVTFLSVLYACSHAGLVREGDEIFHSMVRDYGFVPLAEHYACMVDILGRAGQLKRALEFIKGMPVDPGPPVWGALLGACMIHKDTNLARVASERLFELDPQNMGYYVLMSNVYSAERNYRRAALVRQTAKNRKLTKTPGCTLIEVGQVPHVFTSGDWSHTQSTAIYAELERLTGKMKEAGFQPETDTALHDVEEEEKELMMKVHSEKLAIAFGLISTAPGTEIRIIKNLRVCLDCHTATKFISKITERVIVVRDANRFHHFKDGVCSCGDYW
ncbi:pentatricopeptide repeat-containing protein At4g30700 [Ricinus communis]|uniref:pentatricopeptide repeat-containing protein At4g30700 n=1 Tax=Ricinus communis TaxID=3988 RepID=UPI00201AC98A|nr:pentatricopeptide repeat-containing protein At4g30700 [Ricinus communis]XP_015583307.2 pentatricopeptide repeat-containing protein At4g30700 [Ricinus communis]